MTADTRIHLPEVEFVPAGAVKDAWARVDWLSRWTAAAFFEAALSSHARAQAPEPSPGSHRAASKARGRGAKKKKKRKAVRIKSKMKSKRRGKK